MKEKQAKTVEYHGVLLPLHRVSAEESKVSAHFQTFVEKRIKPVKFLAFIFVRYVFGSFFVRATVRIEGNQKTAETQSSQITKRERKQDS